MQDLTPICAANYLHRLFRESVLDYLAITHLIYQSCIRNRAFAGSQGLSLHLCSTAECDRHEAQFRELEQESLHIHNSKNGPVGVHANEGEAKDRVLCVGRELGQKMLVAIQQLRRLQNLRMLRGLLSTSRTGGCMGFARLQMAVKPAHYVEVGARSAARVEASSQKGAHRRC